MVDTNHLFTPVELYISARGLKNLSKLIGVSDPMCIVSEYMPKTKMWEVVAQTEAKKKDLNPDFPPVEMKYWFEKKQMLKFEIRASDKGKPKGEMGSFETTMGKIMGAKDQIM